MKINKISATIWTLLTVTAMVWFYQQHQILHLYGKYRDNKSNRNKQRFNLFSSVSSPMIHNIPPVFIYNRLPKTGSTSFTHLLINLTDSNNFLVIHVNTTGKRAIWSHRDQQRLVNNISNWRHDKPVVYNGHFQYIDFNKFGGSMNPLYINVIRQPLARLVSSYYFLRYGDDFKTDRLRSKHNDQTSFDDCVKRRGFYCRPEKLWLQIPYFCGHSAECRKHGSIWALEQAKYNLASSYVLVGMTEKMEEFVAVLEATFPDVFFGVTRDYQEGSSHIRHTKHKDVLSEATVAFFRRSKIWQLEQEFYDFAVEEFNSVKKQLTFVDKSGKLQPILQNHPFLFGKINGTI